MKIGDVVRLTIPHGRGIGMIVAVNAFGVHDHSRQWHRVLLDGTLLEWPASQMRVIN